MLLYFFYTESNDIYLNFAAFFLLKPLKNRFMYFSFLKVHNFFGYRQNLNCRLIKHVHQMRGNTIFIIL